MAVHNTAADAANTAVRAFLTEVGEKYWGKTFNTGTGSGKTIWEKIKNEVFRGCCCYCGKHTEKLQIEHLIMFNREEYGLHHPGNVVPCCTDCNKREKKNNNGKHVSWEEHLRIICKESGQEGRFKQRRNNIVKHHEVGEYAYPPLLPGQPDIVLPKYKKVIFVHGCFWHLHKDCRDGTIPKTQYVKWKNKLERNVERDKLHIKVLMANGWKVLILWECEVEKKIGKIEKKLLRVLSLE